MVVNNPNNWHWVDKNCISWSKDYFKQNLVGVSAKDGDNTVSIDSISSVEGDAEVTQRKGKVISLFDLKIMLGFNGTGKEDVSGSITVPELAYDTEEDEIQFVISINNENSEKEAIKPLIKSKLIPQLRQKLSNFGKDLITANSGDIQLEKDKVDSAFTKSNQEAQKEAPKSVPKSTPAPTPAPKSEPEPKKTSTTSSSSSVPKYNTTTLHLEPIFNTTAEQLYLTFLDVQRIGAWTRSAPFIEPMPPAVGSEFKFFGGSISGKFTHLVPNERVVQAWRLNDWKDGHYATLDMFFNQGSSETKMIVKFSGVPIGEEDRVRGNFEDYYIKSIKITFGFGVVL